jgi:tRNA (guanine-N7-)-methyltransferase
LRVEIGYAVTHLFPARSVEVFHLMFPDPWPKRRHSRRRVVTEDFLAAICRALTATGSVQIATDQIEYFRDIERMVSQLPQFIIAPSQSAPNPSSTFEQRFRRDEVEIHRIVLRKVSDVT